MKINMSEIKLPDGISLAEATNIANKAGDDLIDCVIEAIASSNIGSSGSLSDKGNFSYSISSSDESRESNMKIKYIFHIPIEISDTHRDSLYEKKYPEGVDNIYALLNNGYDEISHDVWGTWHGVRVFGRKQRDATHFMKQGVEDFVSKFNGEYDIIDVSISGEYQ